MRARCLAVLALSLLLGADGREQAKPKTDQDALHGSWRPIEQLPKSIPDVRYTLLVFQRDKLTWHCRLDDIRIKAKTAIKLDPKANPKTIDFTSEEGTNKGKTYLGIYELKGDRLKIAYRGPGAKRPKDFDDKADGNETTNFIVLQLEPEA